MMRKLLLTATAVIASLVGAKGNVSVNADLNGNTVYGGATPVSFTEKYVALTVGDVTTSVAKTQKWYTKDETENWQVWTFEICKGEDDAWFTVEFGK